MTSLLEGAKKLVSRSSEIGTRVQGLEQAVDSAEGRVDSAVIDDARSVVDRAAGRLKLSADHTVVALAGATGIRQVVDLQRADRARALGRRRPPPHDVVGHRVRVGQRRRRGAPRVARHPGPPPGHPRLDAVHRQGGQRPRGCRPPRPSRPRLDRGLAPPRGRPARAARRHVRVGPRPAEVRRRGHPRPLPRAARVPQGRDAGRPQPHRHRARGPSRRRWSTTYAACWRPTASPACPVLPISARHGWGIDELEAADRQAGGGEEGDPGPPRGRRPGRRRAPAGGRPAAPRRRPLSKERDRRARRRLRRRRRRADRRQGRRGLDPHCAPTAPPGWPVTAWFSRLKPDPLKRLHLDLGSAGKELTGASRTSVPAGHRRAAGARRHRGARPRRPGRRGDGAAVGHARSARPRSRGCPTSATGSTAPWPPPTSAPTRSPSGPGWCGSCSTLLIVAALVGAGWLALLAFGSYARLPEPPTPEVGGFPVPTLLLLGGIGLGLLLALVCRVAGVADGASAGPRGRQAAARRDLRGLRGDGRRTDPGRAGVLRRGARRAGGRPEVAAAVAGHRAVHRRGATPGRPQRRASVGSAVGRRAEPWASRRTHRRRHEEARR